MRQPFSAERRLSVRDLSDRAQFFRACCPKAEEFEIRWYLLEQHVCSDLVRAAEPHCSFEQRRQLGSQHYVADEGPAVEPCRVERQRIIRRHPEWRRINYQAVSAAGSLSGRVTTKPGK